MFFEEKRNYVAPAIIIEKLETEKIMNHYNTQPEYGVESGNQGWIEGWY